MSERARNWILNIQNIHGAKWRVVLSFFLIYKTDILHLLQVSHFLILLEVKESILFGKQKLPRWDFRYTSVKGYIPISLEWELDFPLAPGSPEGSGCSIGWALWADINWPLLLQGDSFFPSLDLQVNCLKEADLGLGTVACQAQFAQPELTQGTGNKHPSQKLPQLLETRLEKARHLGQVLHHQMEGLVPTWGITDADWVRAQVICWLPVLFICFLLSAS